MLPLAAVTVPRRSSAIMYQADVSADRSFPMLSRLLTRAAPLVVALSMIALIPTVALLGRLGLLTDPMVLACFVLVLGFLAVGLVTTVRRVGNPIGWLLLWQGVVAGISLLSAAYGMYDLQLAAEPCPADRCCCGPAPGSGWHPWVSARSSMCCFLMAGCCPDVGPG